MKKLTAACFVLMLLLSPLRPEAAEGEYRHLYISIGDTTMKIKAEDWPAAEASFGELKKNWNEAKKSNTPESTKVSAAIREAERALQEQDKDMLLKKLPAVSQSLITLEKKENPVDEEALRTEVQKALSPILDSIEAAAGQQDYEQASLEYKRLLTVWSKKENIVREQSIPYYGQIETQLGFLRIALTQEDKNGQQIQTIIHTLMTAVNDFSAGKEAKKQENTYSLATLTNLLEKAQSAIDRSHPEEAVAALQKFITAWPSVEGEIKTKNASLYTELENNIPLIAGKLSASGSTEEKLKSQLADYQQQIELLQKKSGYTMWDAALILLREGLEALLIVSALIAFLSKTGQSRYKKWIWLGAILGVIVSVLAAFLFNTLFSVSTAGANREILEGYTGLAAVAMMLGVGVWLHRKSSTAAWNRYIQSQMGRAISAGSVASMAIVSFLSIFREGAETIIFYMGMAPSISTGQLLSGIGLAAAILIMFAVLFFRFSSRIPIGPFFKVATFFIYALAFKIMGVSLHALQLTGVIGSTHISSLPIIDAAGFYPTVETALPQAGLVLLIIVTALLIRKKA